MTVAIKSFNKRTLEIMANTERKKEAFVVVENPRWPFEEGVWRERTWTDHPEVWANICEFTDCSLFLTTTITRGKCLVRHFLHNDSFSQHWHVMWAQLSRREMWCLVKQLSEWNVPNAKILLTGDLKIPIRVVRDNERVSLKTWTRYKFDRLGLCYYETLSCPRRFEKFTGGGQVLFYAMYRDVGVY